MSDFIFSLLKEAFQKGFKTYKERLSDAEKEVLIECCDKGQLWILRSDGLGEWVRSGTKDFLKQSDRSFQAIYLEAFHSLVRRGYISHEKGILYNLTGTGFQKARHLSTERTIILPPAP